MVATSTFFRLLLLISFVPALVPQGTVFDVELLHRDSPKSPLYNSSMTPFDLLQAAAVRSINRASYLDNRIAMKTSADMQIGMLFDDWEFLMWFSMGTPNPEAVWGVLDTGSELNWVNCGGCQCFNRTSTVFNHSASLSYKELSCLSDECKSFRPGRCTNDQLCVYHYSYRDGSYIDGFFATDTFRFFSLDTFNYTSIPNIQFGCNFRSLHTRNADPGSYIGMGPWSPSLIHQLAPKYISKHFSYCLNNLNGGISSRLFLGRSKPTVAGKASVTQLMTQDSYYAVQLNSISIPDEFDISLSSRGPRLTAGNIIFDSGTAMTILDTQVLDQLVKELMFYINLPVVQTGGQLKLCFSVGSTQQEEQLPGLWFSFAGALGNFRVRPENLFRWYSPRVKCMAIMALDGLQVFGNIMQQDVLVGHDLENMELTLIEKNCTELYKS
ncbi:probable aspartic protease At2g35615 [Zingiber officinale]|uniref:probable aspartic protease At2g35615 n=1 Tax=Zingiber officinale TaxID=94328 RepID=UPI001C4ABF84|nr:probable aspartic protease At2g35615 [Zingiber officinale]